MIEWIKALVRLRRLLDKLINLCDLLHIRLAQLEDRLEGIQRISHIGRFNVLEDDIERLAERLNRLEDEKK